MCMNSQFSFSDSESLPLFLLVIQQQNRRRYLKLCEVYIFLLNEPAASGPPALAVEVTPLSCHSWRVLNLKQIISYA